MAFQNGWRGPDIVSDGLVLYLDAGAPNSYRPDFGTTWKDMSGNNYSESLINSPTFSSFGGGSILFDGINDYTSGSIGNLNTNQITLEAWVYHTAIASTVQRYVSTTTLTSEYAVIRYDGPQGFGAIRFYIVTTTGFKFLVSLASIVANNWYHIVGTWDGTTQRFYRNTSLVASSIQTGTLLTDPISKSLSSPVEVMNGYIPCVRVYNKALSATEVLQNYNAQKSRFGL